jgi:hypothetical protein
MAAAKDDHDPQRELVYEWESDFKGFNIPTLPITACRALVIKACRKYETPGPIVRSHRRGGLSFYQSDKTPSQYTDILAVHEVIKGTATISFRADGRNHAVVLHEASHAILNYWLPLGGYEDHGREFLGVYFWLLEFYDILPAAAIEASAKAVGLQWMKRFTPGRFHRWRQKRAAKARPSAPTASQTSSQAARGSHRRRSRRP